MNRISTLAPDIGLPRVPQAMEPGITHL